MTNKTEIDVREVCLKVANEAFRTWDSGNDLTHPDLTKHFADEFAKLVGPLVEALKYYDENSMAVMAGESTTAHNALAALREVGK